jgi:hypothetical protein
VLAVDAVERADEVEQLPVRRLVEHPPVQSAASDHSDSCPKSWPMNSSCLPGAPHAGRRSVRELLPVVARHAREQRALAVHDLVVADREDEVSLNA